MTNFQDLVANVEHLGTLATVLGAISCPLYGVELTLVSLRAGSLSVLFARVSWRRKSVSEASWRDEWARKSDPARKSLNFDFRPCEVTSLNCQGIKYLTNQQAKQNLNKHDSRFSHSRGSSAL